MHIPMQITIKHTYDDVLKMQKINLPTDNSCAHQPIAAEARRDISNALIENEIARAPAILSGPSKTICCCRACFFVAPPHTCITLHQLYSMIFAMCPNKPSMQLPRKFVMPLDDLWERSPYGFNPGASIVSRNLSSTCL